MDKTRNKIINRRIITPFIKRKDGSVSVFMALVSGVIILSLISTIIYSQNKFNEYLLKSALNRQASLILADYDTRIYDRFGLFAFESPEITDKHTEDFYLSLDNNFKKRPDLTVETLNQLEGQTLYDSVTRFSKIRFPVHAGESLLNTIIEIINSQNNILPELFLSDRLNDGLKKVTYSFNSPDLLEYSDLSSELTAFPKYSAEHSVFSGFSELADIPGLKDIFSGILESFADEKVNELLKNLGDKILSKLEIEEIISFIEFDEGFMGETSNEVYESFVEGGNIWSVITGKLDDFYQKESSSFYQRISFEYYLCEMLSCRVNYSSESNEKIYRKNLRGISFEDINPVSEYEIEKIIFGHADEIKNMNYARNAISALRFISNTVSVLLDDEKLTSYEALSAGISVAIAAISAGYVEIPPEAVKIALIIIDIVKGTIDDWNALTTGQRIELAGMDVADRITLSYKDHLMIFMIFIPLETKLQRLSEIIDAEFNRKYYYKFSYHSPENKLYTGVKINSSYNGKEYAYEKHYY